MTDFTIHYLEMHSPKTLQAKTQPQDFEIIEAQVKEFSFNRYLYQLIGKDWQWLDKLSLSDQAWREYAENDNLSTYVGYVHGSIAGYYELQKQGSGDVEITYLGLAPNFIAKGLGGYLLSHAVATAWKLDGTKRVWLHTCTTDHENALKNYQARGFSLYKTEKD